MKLISYCLIGLAMLSTACAATAETNKEYVPADYLVYVDKPTGFAFIRTPNGWRFVRKLESTQLAEQAAQLQLALYDKR